VLPASASARQVDSILNSQFPPHLTTPTYAVVEAPTRQTHAVTTFAAYLRSLSGAR